MFLVFNNRVTLITDPRHEKSKRTPDEELQEQSDNAISALTGE